MNTAQVTSGLKLPQSHWVWSRCGHPAWQMGPTALPQNPTLQAPCHAPGAMASRANWFKCHWGHWSVFLINVLSMIKRKFGSLSLEKTESLNEISLATLLLKLWVLVLGERRRILWELSKQGAKPKESSAGNQSSGHFRLLLCLYPGFPEKEKDNCLLIGDSFSPS